MKAQRQVRLDGLFTASRQRLQNFVAVNLRQTWIEDHSGGTDQFKGVEDRRTATSDARVETCQVQLDLQEFEHGPIAVADQDLHGRVLNTR